MRRWHAPSAGTGAGKVIEKKGWLLYTKEDSERNRRAVQLFCESAKDLGLSLTLCTDFSHFEDVTCLPDFVINRSRDWRISDCLEKRGIPVFNSTKVTRLCNDKAATLAWADSQGIPVLPWQPGESELLSVQQHFPLVAKACAGHGGTEVFWIQNQKSLRRVEAAFGKEDWILQQAASEPGKDLRIYMIGNRMIKAMLRSSTVDFRSNYCLGGTASSYEPSGEVERMAKHIAEKLQSDYIGIDFLNHKGRLVLNEIEDAVGARMIYEHTRIDIIREYMEYIQSKLEGNCI